MSNISTSLAADGAVSVITMDDGKANALSKTMMAELTDAISEAEQNERIVAVVLAGREGRFSGGFDLEVFASGDMAAVVDMVADGGDLVTKLYGCGVPVVAACTGHAVAAGALMLLGSDVRVGAEGAFKIGLNEVAIGLTLPEWAHTIAKERLSTRHIQRAIANARLTDPTVAVEVGFLDRVVPGDQVLDAAIEEATLMAALDRGAYGKTMNGFRKPTIDQMAQQVAEDRAKA